MTVSRAVIVDASPPMAGHVYDVTTNTQTTDADYTVSVAVKPSLEQTDQRTNH